MYPIAFGVALLGALTLTPVVRRLALRSGLVDMPGERRIHTAPLPLGGGVAMYAAFWLALFAAYPDRSRLAGLFLATTVLVVVGLADDYRELRWHTKLLGQLAAAGLFVALGDRIEFVTHPVTGNPVYIGWWGVPLTIFWLIALTNVVNLIDGLDGLAAGVCAIAAIPLFAVAHDLGRHEAALMTIALGAAALGFLRHNFHPAKIIMGDTGAMFLGFTLAAISVGGALKGPATLAFVVPVLALGLPILDTALAIVRRVAAGRPFYARDTGHLHHRLLAVGLNQRQVALTMYAASSCLAAAAAVVSGSVALFSVLAGLALVFGILPFSRSAVPKDAGRTRGA